MDLPIHPVVPFDPVTDTLIRFDFSEKNNDLTDEVINDPTAFNEYVNRKLSGAGAKYGIGGYAEHRSLYRFSRVFDADHSGDEPRRFHLGTDIWGKPYTPVASPLDAIVHSFAYNNRPGDYGATIILSHHAGGKNFFTLYGHLSLNSIRNLKEGQYIKQGEIFAELGIPEENGQWPPHLHFQIILDLGNYKGDYPGVCKYSERKKWLANSPDPDILLQMNQYLK